MKKKDIAILLMAGNSTRMAEENIKKQFIKINGIPLFIYPLLSLVQSNLFKEIIIVCPSGQEKYVSTELINNHVKQDLINIIPGGKTRNESVQYALDFIHSNGVDKIDTFVYIHDAARPYIPQSILKKLYLTSFEYDAITPAIPLTDSIVKNDKYIDRDKILRIQTPQVFRFSVIYDIYKTNNETTTDDYSKALKANAKCKIILGSPFLYKLTFKEDFDFINEVLKANKCDY